MARYSNSEMTDILLVLGECSGNAAAAVRRYREKYPNRNIPNARTFVSTERRLRETGCLQRRNTDAGRRREARNVRVEQQILDAVINDPTISTRRLGLRTNISHQSVLRVLHEQQLHPYHYRQVQELLPDDMPLRVDFCEVLQNKVQTAPNFLSNILFTDEATFTRQGMFNSRNMHFWAEENPRATMETHFQHTFKINVWAATLGNSFIGYHIFPGNLNGNMYYNFLDNILHDILEDIPLQIRRNMFFMHDGATPHYTRICRRWLHEHFPDRWIGRGADAPIHWPARSCDLNPMDFTVWSYLKSKVYNTPINTVNELRDKIEQVFTDLQNDPVTLNGLMRSLNKRIRLCIQQNGGHFEQLL